MEARERYHMDSLTLWEKAPVRTHADLLRTLYKGLNELAHGGLLTYSNRVWKHNGVAVARESFDVDTMNRERKILEFTNWVCLALALKVSREDVRQVLMDTVAKHPLIGTKN